MTGAALVLLALAVVGHGALTADRLEDQPAVITWVTMSGLVVLGAILAIATAALT